MPKYPHNGMNRRELDTIIRELGGTIEYPRRTGDAIYRHPAFPRPVRVNNRRKDSTRAVVALARAAYDAVDREAGRGSGDLRVSLGPAATPQNPLLVARDEPIEELQEDAPVAVG